MAESELLCVRVATLIRKQICKHTKSDVIKQYILSELSSFFVWFFIYCSLYLPSLNYCPGEKDIHCCCFWQDLGKDKLKS